MKIAYDRSAIADLEKIHDWIAKSRPASAKLVVDRLVGDIAWLAQFPHIGRAGSMKTREWYVPRLPYVIVYEVDEPASVLTVIAVFHTAQDR